MSTEDKSLFDSIEPLSNTPGKWAIFKFKMETAFYSKGWLDHLTQAVDPTDEPHASDDSMTTAAKQNRCERRMEQQQKSKAALLGKLDDMSTQMIMHLGTTHEIWQYLIQSNASVSQAAVTAL